MAVTIVVLSGSEPGSPDLSLTLDSPRIVIGRDQGCEVRLPDASVSGRHASLRQRGGEYVILDENSRNGTFLGPVRLPPQTPRVVRTGERVRLGRVWLELRIEPGVVNGSTAAAARDLALSLVARGLAGTGHEGSAADALAEIERAPDEPMASDDVPSPPAGAVTTDESAPPGEVSSLDTTPTPAPALSGAAARAPRKAPAADTGAWSGMDSAVVLLAVGVLALSVLGGFWLLGR
jgi:predicted component of type VI protein secretion system